MRDREIGRERRDREKNGEGERKTEGERDEYLLVGGRGKESGSERKGVRKQTDGEIERTR